MNGPCTTRDPGRTTTVLVAETWSALCAPYERARPCPRRSFHGSPRDDRHSIHESPLVPALAPFAQAADDRANFETETEARPDRAAETKSGIERFCYTSAFRVGVNQRKKTEPVEPLPWSRSLARTLNLPVCSRVSWCRCGAGF